MKHLFPLKINQKRLYKDSYLTEINGGKSVQFRMIRQGKDYNACFSGSDRWHQARKYRNLFIMNKVISGDFIFS